MTSAVLFYAGIVIAVWVTVISINFLAVPAMLRRRERRADAEHARWLKVAGAAARHAARDAEIARLERLNRELRIEAGEIEPSDPGDPPISTEWFDSHPWMKGPG